MKITARTSGAIATVVASLLLIGIFWGFGWFTHCDTQFFSIGSEDYIKDLYTTTYHVAYDREVTQCHAMNYPHGEYYTFSGLQPLVALPLQALRDAGVPHPERAVLPLLNLLILLSIVLCALFLYLLLFELNLPWWYALVGALLVTLMSPQLQRMGGHITLSYYCAIPILLYLTLRHLHSGAWGWSAAIGVCCLLFGLCHPYYLVFYLVISLSEHIYLLLKRSRSEWSFGRLAISFALQTAVPLCLFFILSHIGLQPGERTAVPSGFHHYRGRIAGLLFPYGRLYFFNDSHLFRTVQWEARSYIGIIGVITVAAILCKAVGNLANRRYGATLRPTDNTALNLFLLAATLLMVFACGVPFQWMPYNTVSYIGPLAQIRAQGRLLWLFYYVINIVALYSLFHWWNIHRNRLRTALFSLLLLLLAGEATAYNWRNKAWYTHNWAEWTDYDNRLPENQCLQALDADAYQAILTLPVFNVGSEFIYLPSKGEMFTRSALLSLKTGLPLVCNESSRSIIKQANDCIALSRTAWAPFAYLNHLPDNRPFLLAVTSDSTLLSPTEQMLREHASPVMEWNGIQLYSLPLSAFRQVVDETSEWLNKWYNRASVDTAHAVVELLDKPLKGDIHEHLTLFDGPIGLKGKVEISFWMAPILDDQYSRSTLKVTAYDNQGNATQLFLWGADGLVDIVNTDANEGLFRLQTTLPEGCSRLKIEMRNREMRPSPVVFNRLLIRPANRHIAYTAAGVKYLDNIPLPEDQPYVSLQDGLFVLNGKPWFPMMLNYKVIMECKDDSITVVPVPWYTDGDMASHFRVIRSWGFNAVRLCLDAIDPYTDTAAMVRATRRAIDIADSAGLHVMLLIHAPLDDYWRDYTATLLRRLSDSPALWAYDFMNEPLYFDPAKRRDKRDAMRIVTEWRSLMRRHAPHQLFTIAFAEPIEVFEWDPALLPVDFIEMHTYHPLRVASEMWWYGHYCGKPWIVGETSLPADGDSVPYAWQQQYMHETYTCAIANGAIGYGWWDFQDCPGGGNFEAQHPGLRDRQGRRKWQGPLRSKLLDKSPIDQPHLPVNYYNMLAYKNVAVTGRVVDDNGFPIEGAVIRGWNEDWSVGMNTFSDVDGHFRLVSNDICTHFEISAPRHTKQKFNRHLHYPAGLPLPDRDLEYQQIDYRPYMPTNGILPTDSTRFTAPEAVNAILGVIKLKRIQ